MKFKKNDLVYVASASNNYLLKIIGYDTKLSLYEVQFIYSKFDNNLDDSHFFYKESELKAVNPLPINQ